MYSDLTPWRTSLRARLLWGQMVLGAGEGLVAASWFLYLSEVRGFGHVVAGLSFSARAVGLLLMALLAGVWIDKWGPRNVVALGTLFAATGYVSLAYGTQAWVALVASLSVGVSVSLTTPATRAMLMAYTEDGDRPRVSGLAFTMWTGGVGTGALVGGIIADPGRPETIIGLFLVSGVLAVLVRLLCIPLMPVRLLSPHKPVTQPAERAGADVKTRSPFTIYLIFTCVLAFGGYGQSASGVPGLATTVFKVSPSLVGIALAVNTVVILILTPFAARLASRTRPTTLIAATAALWVVAWASLASVSVLNIPNTGGTVVVLFYIIFGLGQCALAVAALPLVAKLAAGAGLGKAIGADTFARQLGMATGPAASGWMLSTQDSSLYTYTCMATCGFALLIALILRRAIGTSIDDRGRIGS